MAAVFISFPAYPACLTITPLIPQASDLSQRACTFQVYSLLSFLEKVESEVGVYRRGLERLGVVKSRWRTVELQELSGKQARRASGDSIRDGGPSKRQGQERKENRPGRPGRPVTSSDLKE